MSTASLCSGYSSCAGVDTKESLRSTITVQLALLIAGVTTARALQARGIVPDCVAGHSVGAFGAAVVSVSLAFADALRLVRLRGHLMAQAYPSGYGMAAVMGLRNGLTHLLICAQPSSQPALPGQRQRGRPTSNGRSAR